MQYCKGKRKKELSRHGPDEAERDGGFCQGCGQVILNNLQRKRIAPHYLNKKPRLHLTPLEWRERLHRGGRPRRRRWLEATKYSYVANNIMCQAIEFPFLIGSKETLLDHGKGNSVKAYRYALVSRFGAAINGEDDDDDSVPQHHCVEQNI